MEREEKMLQIVGRRLTAREQTVLTMNVLLGYKTREIAEHLRISPRSASTYLCSAKRKLRLFMEKN